MIDRTVTSTADADPDGAGHGAQVFSAPSDAPRVRRTTDLVAAGTAIALLVRMPNS